MARSTRQPDLGKSTIDATAPFPVEKHQPHVPGTESEPPPTRAEFERLAAQVRRLAAQIAHGRA